MTYVTEHFGELVALFSDPKSRTRRRLRPVYADTLKAMTTVMVDGQTYFAAHDLPDAKAQWDAYLDGFFVRSHATYSPELVPPGIAADELDAWGNLNPDELVPASYEGLVGQGFKVGSIPDAALPSAMASALGVLEKYENIAGRSWWDNLIETITRTPWPKMPDIVPDLKPATDFTKWVVGGIALLVVLRLLKK